MRGVVYFFVPMIWIGTLSMKDYEPGKWIFRLLSFAGVFALVWAASTDPNLKR